MKQDILLVWPYHYHDGVANVLTRLSPRVAAGYSPGGCSLQWRSQRGSHRTHQPTAYAEQRAEPYKWGRIVQGSWFGGHRASYSQVSLTEGKNEDYDGTNDQEEA